MKQRLLVMNGQRLLQTEQDNKWQNTKVDKAGLLKPGIYNLYLSSQTSKTERHEGVILYADKDYIYQQVGKAYVKHDRADFDKVPEIGSTKAIEYRQGRAVVTTPAIKQGRGLSR